MEIISVNTLPSILRPEDIWPERYRFNLDTVTAPLWGIGPGGGRFFKGIRKFLTVAKKLDLLKEAGILFVEAHDTDILELAGDDFADGYPEGLSEEAKMKGLRKAVQEFRCLLAERGMRCGMFTMNLFSAEKEFNYGNYGSENEATRRLAIERTLIGIDMAMELKANVYVYWVGTNGSDGLFSAVHSRRMARTANALIEIAERAHAKYGDSLLPLAIEPKPEEPKFKMYLGSTGSALALINYIRAVRSDLAKFFGVNLELAHIVMGKECPAMSYAEAGMYGLNYHTHFNDQEGVAFDQDLPAGSVNFPRLVDVMYQLHRTEYKGLLGIDVQPLPPDSDEQAIASILQSRGAMLRAVKIARSLDPEIMDRFHAAHDQAGINEHVQRMLYAA
jgi:L-rhamnose isomerase